MIKNINVKSLESKLETIREKAEQLQIIVREIKNMMDKAVETIEKYYYIGKDIIEKYKSYNSKLKNFQVLQTIKNLSYSNKVIIKDLDDIISMNPSQFNSEKKLWISK
jgi:tRNA/tmRNA/rRNA uracil-C5-methylase (TrmA/RlmC/RlmD family)